MRTNFNSIKNKSFDMAATEFNDRQMKWSALSDLFVVVVVFSSSSFTLN